MTQIYAHRGFSGLYPENTMLAFQKAYEVPGLDGIELDIQLTKDGEIVIMHDETLDRTTSGSGNLRDYTLAELKTLSVGVNMKGFFPRQTIPTLREYFEWFKTTEHIYTDVELKTGIVEYLGIEEKLVALVKEFDLEDRLNFSSFNHQSLMRLKKLLPNAKLGLLTETWLSNAGAYSEALGAYSLNPERYYALKEENIAECHSHNIKVFTWTVNKEEDMKKLIAMDCDVMIGNYPDLMSKLLGRM